MRVYHQGPTYLVEYGDADSSCFVRHTDADPATVYGEGAFVFDSATGDLVDVRGSATQHQGDIQWLAFSQDAQDFGRAHLARMGVQVNPFDFAAHMPELAHNPKGKKHSFVGRRVELIHTSDAYTSLRPGSQGVVSFVDDAGTIFVDWDDGSKLGLVPGVDHFSFVGKAAKNPKVTRISRTRGVKSMPGPYSAKRGYQPWIKRRGKLGQGFLTDMTDAQRKRALDRCVKQYGYRSCMGSILALERAKVGPRGKGVGVGIKYAKELRQAREYLKKKYGGPGSYGREREQVARAAEQGAGYRARAANPAKGKHAAEAKAIALRIDHLLTEATKAVDKVEKSRDKRFNKDWDKLGMDSATTPFSASEYAQLEDAKHALEEALALTYKLEVEAGYAGGLEQLKLADYSRRGIQRFRDGIQRTLRACDRCAGGDSDIIYASLDYLRRPYRPSMFGPAPEKAKPRKSRMGKKESKATKKKATKKKGRTSAVEAAKAAKVEAMRAYIAERDAKKAKRIEYPTPEGSVRIAGKDYDSIASALKDLEAREAAMDRAQQLYRESVRAAKLAKRDQDEDAYKKAMASAKGRRVRLVRKATHFRKLRRALQDQGVVANPGHVMGNPGQACVWKTVVDGSVRIPILVWGAGTPTVQEMLNAAPFTVFPGARTKKKLKQEYEVTFRDPDTGDKWKDAAFAIFDPGQSHNDAVERVLDLAFAKPDGLWQTPQVVDEYLDQEIKWKGQTIKLEDDVQAWQWALDEGYTLVKVPDAMKGSRAKFARYYILDVDRDGHFTQTPERKELLKAAKG